MILKNICNNQEIQNCNILYKKIFKKKLNIENNNDLKSLYKFLVRCYYYGIYKKRIFFFYHIPKVFSSLRCYKSLNLPDLVSMHLESRELSRYNMGWNLKKKKKKNNLKREYKQRIRLKFFCHLLRYRREDDHYSWFCLRLAMHKRQQYFITSNFPKWNIAVYSAGQLLTPLSRRVKYYKKAFKNLSVVLLRCRIIWGINATLLRLLFCKNFNFKQYSWLKKFIFYVQPQIQYCILTRSWAYSPKGVRRVKKSVYRNLLKTG